MKTGAHFLIEGVMAEGNNLIFGYPGGVLLGLYDVLTQYPIKHVLVRHEQAAIHAAEGYARSSGQVGVCLATSGPGATNLITGIASAFSDSIPVVILTGQVPLSLIGTDAFQEADTVGITLPIVKHSYLVKDARDIPRIVREAFHIARSGRPGPVLIDLPKDVLNQKVTESFGDPMNLPGYKPTFRGHPVQIEKALSALHEAKRPVIFGGGGVISAEAAHLFRIFVEKSGAPVTTSLMGLGAMPAHHPQFLGMLGMHGTRAANRAIQQADLVFGVGVRFDDRVTGDTKRFAPQAKIVHIDVDPAEIGKNVRADIPIVGDAGAILEELVHGIRPGDYTAWTEKVRQWQQLYPLSYRPSTEVLSPPAVIEEISKQTSGKAIICTEVGQHQMWTAQFYSFLNPRTLITSGGLGAMGFGLPAAIGAQFANPHDLVVEIAGDGSFQMTQQELATIVDHGLPLKMFIVNNGYLGMIRQWQEIFFESNFHESEMSGPDFVKLADAYGIAGLRVSKPDDLPAIVARALEMPGPVLVDCRVSEEVNVFPMVPAGAGIDEAIG